MPGKIFTITSDGTLQALTESPYSREDVFQSLIAQYPDLLAGDQITPAEPRRFLLVRREAAVPDAETTGRWSVDHLFLDQDGVPTLVEVKRSEDTRIRREVIGQLLEYAAHADAYWTADSIRAHILARTGSDDALDALITDFGAFDSADEFWGRVATNLDVGRLRLIFAAERLPSELIRIIEFLNDQMDPAEVLGIELPTFAADTNALRTIAPRVVGISARARDRKTKNTARQRWTRDALLEEFERSLGTRARETVEELIRWSAETHDRVEFGSGATMASFSPSIELPNEVYWFFYVYSSGHVEIQFQWLAPRPPFDDEELRRALMDRLNQIPGVDITPDRLTKRPSFSLSCLYDQGAMRSFQGTIEWALDLARNHHA